MKLPRCFDRFRLQKPWPACHRLAYSPWTRARAARRGETATDECTASSNDPGLLLLGKDVVERPEEQPHAADDIEHLAETHAQRRDLAGGRARAFVGDDGAGQDHGGDLLGAGFHGVALQQRCPSQLPFDVAKVQFVLPPTA